MDINPYAVVTAALDCLDDDDLYKLSALEGDMLLKAIKDKSRCSDDIFFATPEVVEEILDDIIDERMEEEE